MKALLRLAIGVLLTELTFGLPVHPLPTMGCRTRENEKGSGSSAPLSANWRLGAPVSFENLTIFPVIGDEGSAAAGFITLDEGLRSGRSRSPRSAQGGGVRRIRPGRQASDNAEVNKLMLTNRSGKTLVLIAGEMVVGGKQDRIVGHDCLVASNNKPVPLDVFCVEPGRWNQDAAFGQSRNVEQANASNSPRTTRGRTGRSGGIATGSGGGGGSFAGGVGFMPAKEMIAPSNVREKAQAAKDQGRVWAEVAKTERENNTKSATGNLNAVIEDKRVSTRLEDYQRAFATC
jgi:hypothetical protein